MTREEIINGLQAIDAYFRESFNAMDGTLACELFREWSNAAEEAITLLKAQEPRVMTLEEYNEWANIPFTERDPVFLEQKLRRGIITWWTNTTECCREEYGKRERCWTSRPDKATREATPWE